MCFHSKQTKKAQTVENRFNAKIEQIDIFNQLQNFNGFTFPKTPIITNENPETIQMYNWGLLPKWAKDESFRKNTLNARIETIKEKPSFRNSVNERCLVIADGFYEWKWLNEKGSKKEKYLISLPNEELYAYGGIYSEWVNHETGEILNTYSIVTTEANPLVAEIHRKKRMPIILNPKDEKKWLEGDEIENYKLPYSVDLVATNLDDNNTLSLFD
jgi:putative SOS response-associated peptidase YedK